MKTLHRRKFLRDIGLTASALPFVSGLPSLFGDTINSQRKQRLIIMFSPNGTLPDLFWPDATGNDFELKPILKPLEAFKEQMLTLKGVCNRVGGDGDNHMRGMSCLLTGARLNPGNIQGGSHTPAGWSSGISIDQQVKNHLQSRPETRTRFGSLEFGVAVPNRADPWTRMSYADSNKPVAPIDDPHQMLGKIYGQMKDKASVVSVLDDVSTNLKRISSKLSAEDRALLTCMIGGARNPEAAKLDDDQLIQLVLADLRKTMGIAATPEFTRVLRHARGIPQYTIGHPQRLARIDARLPTHTGLTLSGNSYRGVAINACVAEARRLAAPILAKGLTSAADSVRG